MLTFIYILALQCVAFWTAFTFRSLVRKPAFLVAGLLTLLVSLSSVSRCLFSKVSLWIGCYLHLPFYRHALQHHRPHLPSPRFTQWREVSCLVLYFPYCSRICGCHNDPEPQCSENIRYRFVGRIDWKEG